MTERKKSKQKKENQYPYQYQYRYQVPLSLSVPSPLPPSHTRKAHEGARFLALNVKTLDGVGPVQTLAERAARAHTLVIHTPSRQALTGLPGTSQNTNKNNVISLSHAPVTLTVTPGSGFVRRVFSNGTEPNAVD